MKIKMLHRQCWQSARSHVMPVAYGRECMACMPAQTGSQWKLLNHQQLFTMNQHCHFMYQWYIGICAFQGDSFILERFVCTQERKWGCFFSSNGRFYNFFLKRVLKCKNHVRNTQNAKIMENILWKGLAVKQSCHAHAAIYWDAWGVGRGCFGC